MMKHQQIKYFIYAVFVAIVHISCQKSTLEPPKPEPLNLISDCTQPLDYWTMTTVPKPDLPLQKDIFFINKNTGFTVGNYGTINKTEDGGETWHLIHHGNFDNYITQLHFNVIFFLNENEGFIASREKNTDLGEEADLGSIFLKTQDSGDIWQKTYFENINSIYDIHFLNSNVGYGIFSVKKNNDIKVEIMFTENGGNTWEEVDLPIQSIGKVQFYSSPSKLYFIARENTEQEVFVYLDKTTQTWHIQNAPQIDCNRLYFINDNIGFTSCGAFSNVFPEQVYETQDGGQTWTATDFPLTDDALIHFSSLEEGFVIDPVLESHREDTDGFIDIIAFDVFQTDNGGMDWKKSSYVPECNFVGEAPFNMFFIPTDDVIVNYGTRNINIFERK